MSGTFEDIHVPPTLCSFAVTTQKTGDIVSPEFKAAGHKVIRIVPALNADGIPEPEALKAVFAKVTELMRSGRAAACYTPGIGGIAEAVMKMCFGNSIGFSFAEGTEVSVIFEKRYNTFLIELKDNDIPASCESYTVTVVGETCAEEAVSLGSESVSLSELLSVYEDKLESVFSCNIEQGSGKLEKFSASAAEYPAPAVRTARPKVMIPVFPGNNCEYDSAKLVNDSGAEAEIFVIKNLTADAVARSVEEFAAKVRESQMIFIPGGFSGGDEPDGSNAGCV